MARRQQLTEAQIAALYDPPTEPRDLARHYTLSPEDLASVARRRGEHSRLGHALMLLYLRHPGRPLRADGEWLVEKHGTKTRRGWRKLHLATDADTGRIVASALTDKNADDSSQVGPLLDRIEGPVASFTGDGAYDRDDVYAEVAARHHEAAVVVPPRSGAVLGDTAGTAPTQRDRHIEAIAERALVESDVSRWKRVIGDGLRSQTNGRQATEVAIAADVLNRMLDLGRPEYIRIA